MNDDVDALAIHIRLGVELLGTYAKDFHAVYQGEVVVIKFGNDNMIELLLHLLGGGKLRRCGGLLIWGQPWCDYDDIPIHFVRDSCGSADMF